MAAAHGTKVLITGATDGIGKHTATLLASSGFSVILHGRIAQRLEACTSEIQRVASAPVYSYCADFECLDQVRDMARRIAADYSAIKRPDQQRGRLQPSQAHHQRRPGSNVAGQRRRAVFADKHAAQHGVRPRGQRGIHQRCVVPRLEQAQPRKRVHVAGIDISIDSTSAYRYSAHGAYSASKIAMQMFTYALARRLRNQGSSVTANCLDPGTVNTKSTMLLHYSACTCCAQCSTLAGARAASTSKMLEMQTTWQPPQRWRMCPGRTLCTAVRGQAAQPAWTRPCRSSSGRRWRGRRG